MSYKSAYESKDFTHPDTQCVRGINSAHDQYNMPAALVMNSASTFISREQGFNMMQDYGKNFSYQRYGNINVNQLEKKFSEIEQCRFSLAVSSGITAVSLVIRALVNPDSRVVTFSTIFYESLELIREECVNKTAFFEVIDPDTINLCQKILALKPSIVFIESPFNPTLKDIDIIQLSKLCTKNNILLIVDNTVMTPLGLKPLKLGASVVVYSLTKHINGHGDITGGMVSTNSDSLKESVYKLRAREGLILDPCSAWLALRGIRTLSMRLRQHALNANQVCSYIEATFPSIKIITTASTQYSQKNGVNPDLHPGLMVLDFDTQQEAKTFTETLELILVSPTFGNLESTCFHYGSFVEASALIIAGISPGLVRISIGLEDARDIIADFHQALTTAIV